MPEGSEHHAVAGNDLLVVVPGILGSVLTVDGRVVWDFSARSLRGTLKALVAGTLALEGDGEGPPGDGVTPQSLAADTHLIPGLWSIDRYTGLLDSLAATFGRSPGHGIVPFPYDWRLSNRYNASLLADTVERELAAWRRVAGAQAEVQLICHSMGGLLARWFLDVLGGASVTRRLVTIGTPHRGAFDAALALANSYRLGPLPLALDRVVASLASVYQLLPTYPCLGPDGAERRIAEVGLPNADPDRVAAGLRFHADLRRPVDQLTESGQRPRYGIKALVGRGQTTTLAGSVDGGRLVARTTVGHRNHQGDGRVPSFAALPAEWTTDRDAGWIPGKHAGLPNGEGTLAQVLNSIQPSMDLVALRSETDQLRLEVPEVVAAGQPVIVTAHHPDLQRPLEIEVTDLETGTSRGTVALPRYGDGYRAGLSLPAGTWRLTACDRSEEPADPVSDVAVVWD